MPSASPTATGFARARRRVEAWRLWREWLLLVGLTALTAALSVVLFLLVR